MAKTSSTGGRCIKAKFKDQAEAVLTSNFSYLHAQCHVACYLTNLPFLMYGNDILLTILGVVHTLTQLRRKSITLGFTHKCLICWFVTNSISSDVLAMSDVLFFSFVRLSGSTCTALQQVENHLWAFEKILTCFVSRMGCSREDRGCQIKKDVCTQRLINRYEYD